MFASQMNYTELNLYNKLYHRVVKFGVDLTLYTESFYPDVKTLVFTHKYHKGWHISVREDCPILIHEGASE
jgi:hypothetical protein